MDHTRCGGAPARSAAPPRSAAQSAAAARSAAPPRLAAAPLAMPPIQQEKISARGTRAWPIQRKVAAGLATRHMDPSLDPVRTTYECPDSGKGTPLALSWDQAHSASSSRKDWSASPAPDRAAKRESSATTGARYTSVSYAPDPTHVIRSLSTSGEPVSCAAHVRVNAPCKGAWAAIKTAANARARVAPEGVATLAIWVALASRIQMGRAERFEKPPPFRTRRRKP